MRVQRIAVLAVLLLAAVACLLEVPGAEAAKKKKKSATKNKEADLLRSRCDACRAMTSKILANVDKTKTNIEFSGGNPGA